MSRVENYFIGTGIVLALCGMCLGIFMGINGDFTLASVHAHINLVGWVTLVLFGLAYRTGAVIKDGLAMIHYWTALAGAVILPIGIYFAAVQGQPAIAIIGSLLTLLSMVLFLVNYLRTPRAA